MSASAQKKWIEIGEAMKLAAKNQGNKIHVAPRGEKWIVFREGMTEPMQEFDNESDALTFSVKFLSAKETTAVILHDHEGKVNIIRL
jgi:Uncharacterized protein conserved in bacteria (DUF2188)